MMEYNSGFKNKKIFKPKCIYYCKNGFCKNGDNCKFYHPPLCKYKEKCKFKNTTCRFLHFTFEKSNFIFDETQFPSFNELEEKEENYDALMSFKDICQHFQKGKVVFEIDRDSNFDEIFDKIKYCLECKTASIFIFKELV